MWRWLSPSQDALLVLSTAHIIYEVLAQQPRVLSTLDDLAYMNDAELAAAYAVPIAGNPALPILNFPERFVYCAGLTFFNKWSANGAEPGPLPIGPEHPINKLLSAIWKGKLFELTSNGQATYIWQLLHSNHTVGLQARAEIVPFDALGDQVPTIRADYKLSEIVLGRTFLDEFRLVGPNLYLGMAYLVDPFVAWFHLPHDLADVALETSVAVIGTAALEAALASLSMGSLPLPLMFFGLQCSMPVAQYEYIPLTVVSIPLDYALDFFPPGYVVPAQITTANG